MRWQIRKYRNKWSKCASPAGVGKWILYIGGVNGCAMEGMAFYYRMIRGAVGKKFVVKHYKGGRIVLTRFPDMSAIVASEKQKVRRDLFREAVVFAKWIIADEERKRAFKGMLPRKKRKKVYQAALQLYIRERGNKLWLKKVLENIEQQGAVRCVDVRKQLAEQAVVESGKRELLHGNGLWMKVTSTNSLTSLTSLK